MSDTPLDQLADAALRLSYVDRLDLATQLNESLHPPGEPMTQADWLTAWAPELRRRMAESDAGAPGIPAEEIIAELRERRGGE